MNNLPNTIQARRAIEDRAAQLAEQRRKIDSQVAENTQAIIDLIPEAAKVGIPLDQLAEVIGVSRQTLYRWREIARRLEPDESASEMAAKRTPEGHALHFKG
jgi:DNA invertase Pin-like site-specific DNA recombinase